MRFIEQGLWGVSRGASDSGLQEKDVCSPLCRSFDFLVDLELKIKNFLVGDRPSGRQGCLEGHHSGADVIVNLDYIGPEPFRMEVRKVVACRLCIQEGGGKELAYHVEE